MSAIKAKLIRKIPAGKDRYGEQLPYYFDKYELECIECGAHYINGHYDRRTVPYCYNCRRKIESEKNKEYRTRREQNVVNEVLCKVRADIAKKLDNPHEYIVKQDAYNEVADAIDGYIK